MEQQVAVLQPDSILTQIQSKTAPVLQVNVSFKHLVLLNKQTDLQSIQGDRSNAVGRRTQDMLRKKSVQVASLKKISFEKKFEHISYIIMCEFLIKLSVSLQIDISDVPIFMMDVMKNLYNYK